MRRQDRDWGELDDEELARLYGAPKRTDAARIWIWSLVALSVLGLGGLAYTQRPDTTALTTPAEPAVLIGIRGTTQHIPSDFPGGTDTACNEETYSEATRRWTCASWLVNSRHLRIVAPPQYVGACTHLIADQTEARWLCLGTAVTPPDPASPTAPGVSAYQRSLRSDA